MSIPGIVCSIQSRINEKHMADCTHALDSWSSLRRHTSARIALGRAGGSLPTIEVLDFTIAHAFARDAVHAELDTESLIKDLLPLGMETIVLASHARDRQTYLQRPDLGRRLDDASRAALSTLSQKDSDVAIIIGDGLSAPAAQKQSSVLLTELLPLLAKAQISAAPLCIVRHARVAIEDEIGSLLGTKIAVILIGERPGLGTAESLGAYLVFNPRLGRTDAERNCVSNIRPDGLAPADAARTLAYLIIESLRRQVSGVLLKDDRPATQLADGPRPGGNAQIVVNPL
jgi:ethanolamine ammonia-lyase small subunit